MYRTNILARTIKLLKLSPMKNILFSILNTLYNSGKKSETFIFVILIFGIYF